MADLREQDGIEDLRRKLALELRPALASSKPLKRPPCPNPASATGGRSAIWSRALRSCWAHDEFPQLSKEMENHQEGMEGGTSRRGFLQLMGASIALAGLAAGCRRPEGKIHPYNKKPVDVVIGKAMYYATSFVMAGRVIGVLAETHEGRPTKIEGNPRHPNSQGATDVFAQASL